MKASSSVLICGLLLSSAAFAQRTSVPVVDETSFIRSTDQPQPVKATELAPPVTKETATDLASKEMKKLVNESLYVIRANEAKNLSIEEINALNDETFANLNGLQSKKNNLKSLSYDEAQELIYKIYDHPVVGSHAAYDRPGVSIGYCFGRAAWVHLQALREGFKKDQIRKLWVVGPMATGATKWQFHVATAVRDGNGSWWVIDSFVGQPTRPEDWFLNFKKLSLDQELRIYATNPEKFAPTAGKYSRLEMGLDLSKSNDWYSHYFKDMLKADKKIMSESN